MAAGLVLGLPAGGPGPGADADLHRPRLLAVVRPPSRPKSQVPELRQSVHVPRVVKRRPRKRRDAVAPLAAAPGSAFGLVAARPQSGRQAAIGHRPHAGPLGPIEQAAGRRRLQGRQEVLGPRLVEAVAGGRPAESGQSRRCPNRGTHGGQRQAGGNVPPGVGQAVGFHARLRGLARPRQPPGDRCGAAPLQRLDRQRSRPVGDLSQGRRVRRFPRRRSRIPTA